MMYFTKVRINPSSLRRTALLHLAQGDAYSSHDLIWRLFPNRPDANRAFLFRQEFEVEQLNEQNVSQGLPLFYVVSQWKPESNDELMTVQTKPYDPQLVTGTRLAFDLRVNPVVARAETGKKNSPKHDVLMDAKKEAQQRGVTDKDAINAAMQQAVIDWLLARARTNGFRIPEPSGLEISGYRQHEIGRRNSRPIVFSSIDAKGALEVEDPSLFRQFLFTGIGRSRSFGCGMMLVRRI